jgi:hypothetical protein
MGHPISCGCQSRETAALAALGEIWKIVHTPTKNTKHKGASDHFAADFDAIRRICALVLHESPSSSVPLQERSLE